MHRDHGDFVQSQKLSILMKKDPRVLTLHSNPKKNLIWHKQLHDLRASARAGSSLLNEIISQAHTKSNYLLSYKPSCIHLEKMLMTQSSGMVQAAHPAAGGVGMAMVKLKRKTHDLNYSQGVKLWSQIQQYKSRVIPPEVIGMIPYFCNIREIRNAVYNLGMSVELYAERLCSPAMRY